MTIITSHQQIIRLIIAWDVSWEACLLWGGGGASDYLKGQCNKISSPSFFHGLNPPEQFFFVMPSDNQIIKLLLYIF